MKFVRIIEGFGHLWAVKAPDKETDELTILFRNWTNGEYLLDFFIENLKDLKGEHTAIELRKLNRCKNFLQANGVFDKDSFVELTND